MYVKNMVPINLSLPIMLGISPSKVLCGHPQEALDSLFNLLASLCDCSGNILLAVPLVLLFFMIAFFFAKPRNPITHAVGFAERKQENAALCMLSVVWTSRSIIRVYCSKPHQIDENDTRSFT